MRVRGLKICSHDPSPARYGSWSQQQFSKRQLGQLANGSSVWINCYAVRVEQRAEWTEHATWRDHHARLETSVQQASYGKVQLYENTVSIPKSREAVNKNCLKPYQLQVTR